MGVTCSGSVGLCEVAFYSALLCLISIGQCCCGNVWIICNLCGMLAFQVQAFGHPLSPYTSRVFSTVAGKMNKLIRVCIFTLIDYRCTAGLVGCSRQWKWAWPPLRKRDISHRHTTHSSYRHRHSVTCEGKKSSHAQDFKAHFAHSHTLTNN